MIKRNLFLYEFHYIYLTCSLIPTWHLCCRWLPYWSYMPEWDDHLFISPACAGCWSEMVDMSGEVVQETTECIGERWLPSCWWWRASSSSTATGTRVRARRGEGIFHFEIYVLRCWMLLTLHSRIYRLCARGEESQLVREWESASYPNGDDVEGERREQTKLVVNTDWRAWERWGIIIKW